MNKIRLVKMWNYDSFSTFVSQKNEKSEDKATKKWYENRKFEYPVQFFFSHLVLWFSWHCISYSNFDFTIAKVLLLSPDTSLFSSSMVHHLFMSFSQRLPYSTKVKRFGAKVSRAIFPLGKCGNDFKSYLEIQISCHPEHHHLEQKTRKSFSHLNVCSSYSDI